MMPPSLLIDGREAVQIVRERFTCSGDAAVAFLEDQRAAGELELVWPDGAPDPDYRITLDWFASAAAWSTTLQDRADDGERAVSYRRHGRAWTYRLRRQQLEECCERAAAPPVSQKRAHINPRGTPKLDGVVQKMREYIDEHDGADLRGMPGKVLASLFQASRDTCARALEVIYGDAAG